MRGVPTGAKGAYGCEGCVRVRGARDAKLVGLLPESIQLWTVYAAAIPASSADPAAARAFVAALTGPAMRDRWIKAGWEPLK